jgi:hypothetical protein
MTADTESVSSKRGLPGGLARIRATDPMTGTLIDVLSVKGFGTTRPSRHRVRWVRSDPPGGGLPLVDTF